MMKIEPQVPSVATLPSTEPEPLHVSSASVEQARAVSDQIRVLRRGERARVQRSLMRLVASLSVQA